MSAVPVQADRTARLSPRASVALVVAGASVLGTLAGLRPISDPDYFWHVQTGAVAIATGSTVPRDPFSFSFEGHPWAYKDLVADVLFAVGDHLFGTPSVVVLKVVVAALLALALWGAPPRATRSVALAWAGLAVLLSAFLLVERPNVLSFAFFAGTLAVLERGEEALPGADGRSWLRWTLLQATLLVAWAFVHRFALIGFALVAFAYARQALAAALGPRRRWWIGAGGPSRRLLVQAALLAAATVLAFAHPSGIALVHTALRSIFVDASLRVTSEWQSLPLRQLVAVFPMAMASLLVAIVVVASRFVLQARHRAEARLHGGHAVVVCGFAALVLRNARWMPYATIVAVLVVTAAVAEPVGRILEGASDRVRRGLGALTFLVGALVVFVSREDDPFDASENPRWVPAGALAFAREHGLRPRVANAFDYGGYVIRHGWPQFRVLVDGRNEIVYPPEFVVRAVRAEHDLATFRAMRAEDGADWALGTATGSFAFLARDPAWALVYWSEEGVVYVRADAYPALLPLRYKLIDPVALEQSVWAATQALARDPDGLQALGNEIGRLVAANPDEVRPQLALAVFLTAFGPARAAEREGVLERVLALRGQDRAVLAAVTAVRSLAKEAAIEP